VRKLQLKPQQKAVSSYYSALGQFKALEVSHETAMRDAFQDPNRSDDPQYILRLVAQVINVSLKTVKIVRGLPDSGLQARDDAKAL
jgi:hypothetical protein